MNINQNYIDATPDAKAHSSIFSSALEERNVKYILQKYEKNQWWTVYVTNTYEEMIEYNKNLKNKQTPHRIIKQAETAFLLHCIPVKEENHEYIGSN